MPRRKTKTNPHRINLELSQPVLERLLTLVEKMQAESMAEVIRRSITLCACIQEELARGNKLIVRKGDRERELVIIL